MTTASTRRTKSTISPAFTRAREAGRGFWRRWRRSLAARSLMPTIAIFYGIVIQMYWRDHAPPHIHAMYQGCEALIAIESGKVIGGPRPGRTRMIEIIKILGLQGIEWVILGDHSGGSMQVRTLRRRYSSSRSPYARLWKTRILLLRPSTNPSETLFSGLQ